MCFENVCNREIHLFRCDLGQGMQICEIIVKSHSEFGGHLVFDIFRRTEKLLSALAVIPSTYSTCLDK